MINFALNNIDVVRAMNFQPVSLVGRMPTGQRERQRITDTRRDKAHRGADQWRR